jgi:integrase/recombinase XerD
MLRKAVVTVYVRHRAECQHDGKPFFRGCDCPKWLRYSGDACLCGRSHKGRQHRFAAGVRSWAPAEEKREEAQKRLDAGDRTPLPVTESQKTIKQSIETFLLAKQGERLSNATIRKLRYQLFLFDSFMGDRSRFFPLEITATDVVEYRSTWKWKSGVTQQKAQQNLRGFLRSCCTDNLKQLLDALKPIKLSKADNARLEPQPFTEEELKKLLAQVPDTFPETEKAARVTALIHLQVATGLAIRDAVQLERTNIADGWLRIKRQKTDKPVRQKLDLSLHRELIAATNGNPRYVFWNGTSLPESATGLWQEDLRTLMKAAGLWIKGNLSHRFRDTAVDFWLGQGWTLTDVADALGDTVAVVERHYKSLENKRTEERLARLPVRAWGATQ